MLRSPQLLAALHCQIHHHTLHQARPQSWPSTTYATCRSASPGAKQVVSILVARLWSVFNLVIGRVGERTETAGRNLVRGLFLRLEGLGSSRRSRFPRRCTVSRRTASQPSGTPRLKLRRSAGPNGWEPLDTRPLVVSRWDRPVLGVGQQQEVGENSMLM